MEETVNNYRKDVREADDRSGDGGRGRAVTRAVQGDVGGELFRYRPVVAIELFESGANVRHPSELRGWIYTTNTIALLNMTLRKVTKDRSLCLNNEAVFKLMYLALRNINKRWPMPVKHLSGAMNQFAILCEGRVPMGGLNSNSLTRNPA